MEKIDFKKREKTLYAPKVGEHTIVDVPAMHFLMIDGAGDPNSSPEYAQAVEALFVLSYTIKFAVKKRQAEPADYGVLPLEGLWWADDMEAFAAGDKSAWKWTMMIRQPDAYVDAPLVETQRRAAAKKKPLEALERIRFEAFTEGLCAQTMHRGPFSEEGPVIAALHAWLEEGGYRRRDKHHEIYLSDIRRAAPEKWRTVLRQPVERV